MDTLMHTCIHAHVYTCPATLMASLADVFVPIVVRWCLVIDASETKRKKSPFVCITDASKIRSRSKQDSKAGSVQCSSKLPKQVPKQGPGAGCAAKGTRLLYPMDYFCLVDLLICCLFAFVYVYVLCTRWTTEEMRIRYEEMHDELAKATHETALPH